MLDTKQKQRHIIGDMNRAIGTGQLGVGGNKASISFGGQLLRDLLTTGRYILLNSLSLAEGRPMTWVSRSNSSVQSFLDLRIVLAGLAPFVSKFLVHKNQKFTPRRVRKRHKRIISTYAHHYSIEVWTQGTTGWKKPPDLPKGW